VLVGAASGELGQLVSEKWPVRSVDAEQLTAYRQPRGSEVHLVQFAAILNDDPGQAPAATSAKTKPASHPCIRS